MEIDNTDLMVPVVSGAIRVIYMANQSGGVYE